MIGSMFRKAWYSDSATLNLDFTSGVLDSRLTFARAANTATVINSSGLVQTVNADVPRFDHDPTTLAPRGLLIEGTATNLVTYSPCSTTGWAGINATGTNNSDTSPENTTTATLWTGGGGGVNRVYSASFSVTSGATYTISAYVKKPSSNAARYAKIDVRSAVEALIGWPTNGVLDLDTGIASGTGYTVTPMQNGWYRIVSTGTVNSTTTARMFLRITDAAGAEITSTNALLWWGAQAEAGSGASSYIPTTNSTATRNADECSMTGTNFSSWYNQSEGTVLAKWRQWNVGGNEFAIAARFALASGIANSIWIAKQNASSAGRRIEFEMRDASGTQRVFSVANPVTDPVITAAGAQKFGDTFGMSYNGATTVSTTQTRTPSPDRLFIGSYDLTSGHINSTISQLKYWPTRLPDATLQSLTT